MQKHLAGNMCLYDNGAIQISVAFFFQHATSNIIFFFVILIIKIKGAAYL